jgi:DnaK suppressor protein
MKITPPAPFQETLERLREETLHSLSRTRKEGRGVKQDSPQDTGERSESSFSKEFLFQRSTEQRLLLRQIEAALQRIQAGTFGKCLSCGEQINFKRLEAMPSAEYCRDCQEVFEHETPQERAECGTLLNPHPHKR